VAAEPEAQPPGVERTGCLDGATETVETDPIHLDPAPRANLTTGDGRDVRPIFSACANVAIGKVACPDDGPDASIHRKQTLRF